MEYRYEKIFNALLDIASDEAMLRDINAIPICDELDNTYMPTESMDKKIRRIISRIEHSKRAKSLIKTVGRTAVGVLLILIISVTVLLSVQASKNYIFNTFIDSFDDHTTFEFKESDPISLYDKYSLNYIPTGFKLQSNTSSRIMSKSIYINENGLVIFFEQFFSIPFSSLIDNKKNDYLLISIRNSEAYMFKSKNDDETNIIIWKEDDVVFKLSSEINTHQLILISNNISKK